MSETKEVVRIGANDFTVEGDLDIPENAQALVIFSGNGSGDRFSPATNFLKQQFEAEGFATLALDLLTPAEDTALTLHSKVKVMADRLVRVTSFMANHPLAAKLRKGYFGNGFGSAAALLAGIALENKINAIVSLAGRPDLVHNILHKVRTPVLFIVGESDAELLPLSWTAYQQLGFCKDLEVIHNAGRTFEGEGVTEQVARLACQWFNEHFSVANPELLRH